MLDHHKCWAFAQHLRSEVGCELSQVSLFLSYHHQGSQQCPSQPKSNQFTVKHGLLIYGCSMAVHELSFSSAAIDKTSIYIQIKDWKLGQIQRLHQLHLVFMFPSHQCTLFHACIHYFEFLSTKPELSPLTKRADNSISMRCIQNEIIDKINEINNIITKSICDLCNILIKCCFLLFIHLIITVRQKGKSHGPYF